MYKNFNEIFSKIFKHLNLDFYFSGNHSTWNNIVLYGISLKCSPKLTVYFSENVLAIQPAFKSVTDYHTKFEAASDDHVFRVIERIFGACKWIWGPFFSPQKSSWRRFWSLLILFASGPQIFYSVTDSNQLDLNTEIRIFLSFDGILSALLAFVNVE